MTAFVVGVDDPACSQCTPFPYISNLWMPSVFSPSPGIEGGFANYDRNSNTLDASLFQEIGEDLQMHPDGTWAAQLGGTINETGVYSIQVVVPEPCAILLLATIASLLLFAHTRRTHQRATTTPAETVLGLLGAPGTPVV